VQVEEWGKTIQLDKRQLDYGIVERLGTEQDSEID
jgi:hypothetical protein